MTDETRRLWVGGVPKDALEILFRIVAQNAIKAERARITAGIRAAMALDDANTGHGKAKAVAYRCALAIVRGENAHD